MSDEFRIPTFQEQYLQDLDDVFFNAENKELPTEHIIDGKKINVILDNERLSERNVKDSIENVFLESILFFVKKADIHYEPVIGKLMMFDNRRYYIENVIWYGGYFEITLTIARG